MQRGTVFGVEKNPLWDSIQKGVEKYSDYDILKANPLKKLMNEGGILAEGSPLRDINSDLYANIKTWTLWVILITALISIIRWACNAHEANKSMPGRRSFLKSLAWKGILAIVVNNYMWIYKTIYEIIEEVKSVF